MYDALEAFLSIMGQQVNQKFGRGKVVSNHAFTNLLTISDCTKMTFVLPVVTNVSIIYIVIKFLSRAAPATVFLFYVHNTRLREADNFR